MIPKNLLRTLVRNMSTQATEKCLEPQPFYSYKCTCMDICKTVYKGKRGKSFCYIELHFVFASAIMTSTECLLFQCFCSMHFLTGYVLIMYNIPYICHFSAKGKREQETPSSCKRWICFEIFNYKKCK